MVVLVSYDVAIKGNGARRLRRIAKTCENFGQRVQNSVFECVVDPAQWTFFKQKLFDIYDPEQDSLRFYFLGSNWKNRIEHYGVKKGPDPDETLII